MLACHLKLIFQNPLHSTVCTTDINKEPIDDTEVAQSNNLVCRIRSQKIVLNAISILKEEGTHLTEMITSDMSKLSIPMLNVTVHIFFANVKKRCLRKINIDLTDLIYSAVKKKFETKDNS